MRGEIMSFPKNIEDFLNDYSFEDYERIYTNGSQLIPTFRVKQAFEHYIPHWIPVNTSIPLDNQWVVVTVKRHRWISDYDEKYVPEDEKIDHSEKVYCTLGRYEKDTGWKYIDLEMDGDEPVAYFENDCSVEDLSYPMTEVVAWMPLLKPWKGGNV